MKKLLTVLLASMLLVGCTNKPSGTETQPATDGSSETQTTVSDRKQPEKTGSHDLDTLEIQFVPSKDADVIITGTAGLDKLLIDELAKSGFNVGKVNITVGTSYDTTGEGLAAGSVHVGWLPGGTYALFSNEADVILTATRNGLSNDSEDPKTWNGDANATQKNGPQVSYYRSLIYATPSAYGKELAAKVNAGEKLTWEELNKANWAVLKTSSSAGYIYPTMWLMDNYEGKKITDLANVITLDGYGTAFSQAASESVDIIVCYADGRNDYEASWMLPVDQQDETKKAGLGRSESIWTELNVIGVTAPIYNDTVAITMADPNIYNEEFINALQTALINIINSEEGKAIFSVYSHNGYSKAVDSDYDGARAALKAVQE
ncbi:MAG: PhnD/SsuA/transferrin family substrate-binding protein [Erysipelotrichaceae bacterium]|nr:PhnD/SsuA/transferrin family substrate-binding protein [Erysipelotrichaceae bacterium]